MELDSRPSSEAQVVRVAGHVESAAVAHQIATAALAGLAPLSVALACALAVVAASHWLGLDLLVVLGTVFERIAR